MTVYKNLSLGSERALYAIKDAEVKIAFSPGRKTDNPH